MRSRVVVLVVVCLFGLSARAAWAQPTAEVGSTLTSLVFQSAKSFDVTTFGLGTVITLDPSVYASFFLGSNAAVEPRVGLLWESSGGQSDHVVTAAVQFDYFTGGSATRSPFVFVGGGISDTSGPGVNPKFVSVGGGMRLPAGDRLAFRLDAHYTRYTQAPTGMPSPLNSRSAESSITGSGSHPPPHVLLVALDPPGF